jgi:hypothetical protein
MPWEDRGLKHDLMSVKFVGSLLAVCHAEKTERERGTWHMYLDGVVFFIRSLSFLIDVIGFPSIQKGKAMQTSGDEQKLLYLHVITGVLNHLLE